MFLRGDYESLDFADYDAVFAYLSPAAMTALWRKARREMRPGTRLVSNTFAVPGVEPDETHAVEDLHRSTLFVYVVPDDGRAHRG